MLDANTLGSAGALGALWFAVAVLALAIHHRAFLYERGWHPVRANDVPFPSILALSPTGGVQTLSFAVLGAALLAVAVGLWQVLDPRPTLAILALAAAGLAGFGLMAPTDGSVSSVRTLPGAVHLVAFLVLLAGIVLAALLLGLDLRGQPTWAGMALLSLAVAASTVLLTIASFVVPAVGSLASILSIAVMLAWLGVLGLRLAVG